MPARQIRNICLVSLLALSSAACMGKADYTPTEKEVASTMTPSQFQPATREMRRNIETQELFAQGAFWGREYQLNPADLEAAIKLAAAVRKMGNPTKAIEITQTTRAMYPEDPYLTAEYAAALIAAERGSEAIKALDGGLRKAPGYARLWSLKGAALDQMENYELARRHYGQALKITPRDPNVMANLGLSYALAGDPAKAEVWLQRAAAQPEAGESIHRNLKLVRDLQGKSTATAQRSPQPPAMRGRVPAPQTAYNNQRPSQQMRGQSTRQSTRQPARQPAGNGYGTPAQPQQGYQAPPQASQTYSRMAARQQQERAQNRAAQRTQRSQYDRYEEQGAPEGFRMQASNNPAPARQSAPMRFTQQMPQTQQAAQDRAGIGHRSSFAYTGKQASIQSASDAARAAARQSQARGQKVVVPMGTEPQSAPQRDILAQIAGSIGPQPSSEPAMTRPPMPQQYQPEQLYSNPQVQMETYPYGYQQQVRNQAPAPRGAARRR